jgi:hypothetical protein
VRKKKKFEQYKQGLFHPLNNEKYKGTLPIVFRSNWEFKLMQWLDKCQSCVSWGSESTVINYISPIDNKNHRYFLDFTAVFKDKQGALKKYIIEVKPYKQTLKPVQTPNKKQTTYMTEVTAYMKNCAKWKAAKRYADSKGYKFIIITEQQLFI